MGKDKANFKDVFSGDYKPRSSVHSLGQFIDSSVHQDFKRELECRIEDLRTYLETCNSKEFIETQGAVRFARMMTGIFEDLQKNRESDNREADAKAKENEDG
jgi:hypothetical protein